MLSKLNIKNYAIIKQLEVDFASGFCVVTGETGAGKSIIMGALGLILGQRADTSVLNNDQGKCIVEGRFLVQETKELKFFFEQNDLDYELPVLLRREINSSGKSRAFINDTPVQLTLIRELGLRLIDIHSQHSNLELGKRQFQLNVIDWYCGHDDLIYSYSLLFQQLKAWEKKQEKLVEKASQSKADLDYYEFQFKQLNDLNLLEGEQEKLEKEHELLTHSEEIKVGLNNVYQLLDGEEFNTISKLKEVSNLFQKLTAFLPEATDLHSRIESQHIEMRDIADECEQLAEQSEHDPQKLEIVSDRLDVIYSFQQKHRVDSVEALIELRNDFDAKIQDAASFDEELIQLDKEIADLRENVKIAGHALHESRAKQIPSISKEITSYLNQLGMPNGVFKIELNQKVEFGPSGIDEVFFMFTANMGSKLEEINKVASGGELSRLMLAIKTVVAKSKALPAIIFDEIDSGISGEIASKMGSILKQMAKYMQVINITHLPQIASKGESHYQVYKNETNDNVETGIRLLHNNERIVEIAKMLSDDSPDKAALENAKSLLVKR